VAIAVDAVELEDVYGDLDAQDLDTHRSSSSVSGSQPALREGEPSSRLAGGSIMTVCAPINSRCLSVCRRRMNGRGGRCRM
jgi:hypothetical protein